MRPAARRALSPPSQPSLCHATTAYTHRTTKLLERALEAVRRLPPDTQDEIARAMLTLAGDGGEPEPIDAAHLPGVRKLVTRRYPYLVYYTCDLAADEIIVIAIQHPARERA